MAGILSATVGTASHLAARIAYASIEGVAFLLTRPAAAIIAGAELLVLLKTAGPHEVLSTALKAAVSAAIARSVWAFMAATQASTKRKAVTPSVSGKTSASASTASLAGDAAQDQATAAVATMAVAATASGSIWDWEPPESDAMYSGAWHVLRELVLTTNTLKAENPEIYEVMERPEATPAEMLVRLHYLAVTEEKQSVTDAYELNNTENEVRPADESDLEMLRHMRPLASMAYDLTDDAALATALATRGYRLLAARYEPDLASTCPAYFLAISQEEGDCDGKTKSAGAGASRWDNREVVLCVRGTYSPEDVFTDLLAAGSTFSTDPDGTTHSVHAGMARGARFLFDKFGALLASLRDAGVGITLMGHSLGAGVSSLLSLHLLAAGFDASNLRCLAYETPACMDLPLARSCAGVVTSLVTADDIVPRMAVQPFYNLLKELVAFDWRAAAERYDGGQLPAPLAMMQKMSAMFASKPSVSEKTAAAQEGGESGDQPEGHRPEAACLDSPGELVTAAAKYNPFVPGNVIFVALPPGESGTEPDPSTAIRVQLEPTHPALRRIRVTSRFILDHFIDHAYNIAALGEVKTADEAAALGKAD